jgi:hypothetical protein
VLVASGVPPVAAEYHWIAVPVAERFAIVGEAVAQKVWEADPVGAGGSVRFTRTGSLVVLSQPETVWVA